jgi:predicted hydrocarbon binding protein
LREKSILTSTDINISHFLKEWFSGFFEGLEKLGDETWPSVLEMTGRACAQIHSGEIFKETWNNTQNLEEFCSNLNTKRNGEIYRKLNSHTLEVSYTRCKCPLVKFRLVDSPILCDCSPNWLAENLVSVLKKSVDVKTECTILRGAQYCRFIISIE